MAEDRIKLILDAIDNTKGAFQGVSNSMKKLENESRSTIASVGAYWSKLTTIFGVIAGAAGIGALAKSFIDAAAEAELVEKRLRYTMESIGYQWGEAKGAVDAYAQSMAVMTRFSDEEAREALNQMFLYTTKFSEAQKGATMAMDMAVKEEMDLKTATQYIGMAMAGNVERLGRFIFEFRHLNEVLGENATAAQKAEYAWKILQEKFGGTAQAEIGTYIRSTKDLQKAWDDLKEELGKGIMPFVTDWVTG